MQPFIARRDYEFILLSSKFCHNIGKYVNRLKLDYDQVRNYLKENELFFHVFEHKDDYGTLADSYMQYKIENMRQSFALLEEACRISPYYTLGIGQDLGIESELLDFSLN